MKKNTEHIDRLKKGKHESAEKAVNSRVWPVVLAAAMITVIVLFSAFGSDLCSWFRARETQEELKDLYYKNGAASIMDIFFPSASAEESADVLSQESGIHEDFTGLYDVNQHIVGWLSAGGDIDYPVVQYDNVFYLEHDFYGRSDRNGTLFINESNLLEPRDSVLMIHGHNMKSGAMFGNLDLFREYSYLQEHPIVTFRTIWDAEDVHYVPIAAFDASMTEGSYGFFNIARFCFDFDIPADQEGGEMRSTELEQYIADMRDLSFWDAPVEADSTDEYIMLVTCSYNHDDGRLILLCRKLRDGETVEGMAKLYLNK